MGWSDDEIVFFGAARLSDQKAHHFLIEGFAGLPRTTRARLALAGEGPKRPDLEALIARLGAGDRVTLLGARRDIPELLGGADVYATSSLQEGHPLSILEAMAVNLPVVAPRLPTIEEIALDGTPLFYGPPKSGSPESHDPKDITPVLAQAIERIDELRDKAEKARATVARLYSLEAMNDKHAALYQAILRGGPSRWASRLGGRLFV
jgi:glycosyltransferase involved in cell wall biosynthesis